MIARSLEARSGVGWFDPVRIRTTPLTVAAGIADRIGIVYGHSTPSEGWITEIIGEPVDDVAVNVHFDELDRGFWLAHDLVETVHSQPTSGSEREGEA